MRTRIETLERIRQTLNLPLEDWTEMLCMTRTGYDLLKVKEVCELPDSVVSEVCGILEIAPASLETGILDYKALAKHHSGNVSYLPERYSEGAFSRRRTSGHLLDLLEIRRGWNAKVRVLRRFQVTEALFSEPDARISLRFLSDLCMHLREEGITEKELFAMGQHSVVTNYAGVLGRHFRKLGSPRAAYESCFTELINRYYDENFEYRLVRMSDTSCVIECRYRNEVLDASRSFAPGSVGTCAARAGAFSSIPGYLDLPYSRVREVSCLHRGDDCCRYEIDFEAAATAVPSC